MGFKRRYHQFTQWINRQIKKITPGKQAVKGSALLLLITTSLLWFVFGIWNSIGAKDPWFFALFVLLYVAIVIFGYSARWLFKKLGRINSFYLLSLLIAFPLLIFILSDPLAVLLVFVTLTLLGAGVFVLQKTGFKKLSRVKKVMTALGLMVGIAGLVGGTFAYTKKGFAMDEMVNAAWLSEANIANIAAPNPAQAGSYSVKTLYYGSGKDKHREEFGQQVNIKTQAVNGIPFIDGWEGASGWWRENYWGFKSDSLPLNARVWYPDGTGPFPLALVVHGNHLMQDFSDPGYEYLGQLLASRGIILASVDENFINSSWSDIFGGLEAENDARGWLLLEHLRAWHEWNSTPGNKFYQKIDTDNIALIGHSRGGEAVAHAAMFNRLSHYPDDASIGFNYNYNIKSIVAIAPVDGQYKAGDSSTEIQDVSYFVIHGAQDADVSSFMGSQQYERIKFKDSSYHFKAGLYVYGANHGQFNSSWGNNDTGMFTGLLNLEQLLSEADQQQIASVYISSFFDITLKGKKEYLPLFLDARKGKEWLPKTLYLNQFEDAQLQPLANFDEDFDVSTLSATNAKATAENLTVWREAEIELKWNKKGSRALFLGWDYEMEGKKDSLAKIADSLVASYTIKLPEKAIDSAGALVFAMAESKENTNPKKSGKWVVNKNENEDTDKEDAEVKEKSESEENQEEDKEDKPEPPLDFTIEITDQQGQKVSFLLSEFSGLQREIKVMIMKVGFLTQDSQSEKVFQTFYFPLDDLREFNPDFDPANLKQIRFVFNKSKKGVVVIDNIGFMKRFEALLEH